MGSEKVIELIIKDNVIHIYEEVLKNFYIFDNYHHMASKIQVKMKNIKVFEFYLSNFQQVEFGSGTTSGSVAPSQSSPLTTTSATAGVIKAGWTGLLSTESTALVLESIVILIEHILLHPPPKKILLRGLTIKSQFFLR